MSDVWDVDAECNSRGTNSSSGGGYILHVRMKLRVIGREPFIGCRLMENILVSRCIQKVLMVNYSSCCLILLCGKMI